MRNVGMIVILAVVLTGASRCERSPRDEDPSEGGGSAGSGNGPAGSGGGHAGSGSGHAGSGSAGSGTEPSQGEPCGPTTCARGEVCCNESCGICTAPDGFCTEQFCGDDSGPLPSGPSCGGIAGIQCPGAGSCVDDPSDTCDPEHGGADCGGVCTCSGAAVLCITGTIFNDDPNVCECQPADGGGEPCGPATCAEGQVCCNESCGICTEPGGSCTEQFCGDPEPPAPHCGGFAGIACPGEGECADDPSDDCDPEHGGADCGGLCECTVGPLIDCAPDRIFDDSPAVCACVPLKTGEACGPNTCGDGEVCCNASCGICTPPDGACIQIACE